MLSGLRKVKRTEVAPMNIKTPEGKSISTLTNELNEIAELYGAGADEFMDLHSEFFDSSEDHKWNRLCNVYTELVDATQGDKNSILKLLAELHKRKEKKGKRKAPKEEFDYNEWKNELLAPKPQIKYIDCTINYIDKFGIAYLYTHTLSEDNKISPLITVSTAIPVFSQEVVVNGGIPKLDRVSGTFPQEVYVNSGVEKFLQPNLSVEMRDLLLRVLKEPLSSWKPISRGKKNGCSECVCIQDYSLLKNIKEKTCNKSEYYLDYGDKRYNKLIVCWIFGTYVLPVFTYFPYLTFFGLRNTAKTTNIDFILKWGFNGGGNTIIASKSSFFRNIHGSKGVVGIDHFEKVKRDSEYYSWVTLALEGGWNKNSCVRISEKFGDSYVPKDYSIFAPYVIGTRRLSEVFEEKGIVIETEQTEQAIFKERCDQMDNDPDFQTFIRYGLEFGLLYGEKVKEVYDNFDDLHDLNSRAYNIVKPILSIAKVLMPDDYDDIKALLLELMKRREEEREDREETLLIYLAAHENIIKIVLSDLTKAMETFYPGIHFNAIKGDMRKLKIGKKHSTHPIVYYLDRSAIEQKIKIRGLKKKLEEWLEGAKEKNICDNCGEEAFTTEYEGEELCQDCRQMREKYKSQEEEGQRRLGTLATNKNTLEGSETKVKKQKPTRLVNAKDDLDEDGNVIKKPKPEAPSEEKIKSDIESAKRSLEESGLRESRDKEDSDSDEDNEKAVSKAITEILQDDPDFLTRDDEDHVFTVRSQLGENDVEVDNATIVKVLEREKGANRGVVG